MKRTVHAVALLLCLTLLWPASLADQQGGGSSGGSLWDGLTALFGKGGSDAQQDDFLYWPSSVPDTQDADWRFTPSDIAAPGAGSLTMVSVSPSGNIVAAVDRSAIDPANRQAAGVANPMGRLPDAVYLFAKRQGRYLLDKKIAVDPQAQLELSSLLGGGSAFSWNEDETLAVVTGKWGAASETLNHAATCHTNLYLLDAGTGEFRRLTDNSAAGENCVLAQWSSQDTVRFVRMSSDDGWKNSLCEIDIRTGKETVLAELYSAGGAASLPLSWQEESGEIYYALFGMTGQTGFYVSPMGGSEWDARCLIDVKRDLVDTNRHPYCASRGIARVEISQDGRWACLSLCDSRVDRLDIPFADHPTQPQADPGRAVSTITHRPWVPCHNVLLYDLKSGGLVDPFADPALSPSTAIVTAACFAPDGQSLLCAVFGDGGDWTAVDVKRAAFYQIDVAYDGWEAVRVFETELDSSLSFPEGIQWLKDNSICIPTAKAPFDLIQMVRPSAFAAYPQR